MANFPSRQQSELPPGFGQSRRFAGFAHIKTFGTNKFDVGNASKAGKVPHVAGLAVEPRC